MGFFKKIFGSEERVLEIDNVEERNVNMANYGLDITNMQESTVVDEDTIQTIPTANSCIELITGTIAQLPIYLYKEDEDGNVKKINEDERLFLLNNEANENLSSFNFKKTIAKDFLLHGGTYTYIEKKGNMITGLYPLPAKRCTIRRYIDKKGYKYNLEISYAGLSGQNVYKPYELLMVLRNTPDGSETKGILDQGKKIFELALNESEYSSNILNKGALPIGILETEGKLNRDMAERLKASWERLYTGVKNAGKTVVLEEGIKYKPLSLSPSDLNLNESKKISAEEICKLFNIPPSLVTGDKGYGNLEQDNLHFSKYCLSTIISNIEAELDRSLLLEEEKAEGYYFRFALDEILRSTEVEKYTAIEKGMKAGVMSINEARAKLDLEPLEKDYIMFSLGNVFYDKDNKKFVVPNTGEGMGGEDPVKQENVDKLINDDNSSKKNIKKDEKTD